ncbi:MAG: hypothetical protein MO852_17350, partial [Candidatus Devosia euplotis]|nr:hypothetical protein [Candidatus Devosia euplotis]
MMSRFVWFVTLVAWAVACKPAEAPPKTSPPPPGAPPKTAPPPPAPTKGVPPVAGTVAPPKREASKAQFDATIAKLTEAVKPGVMDPTNPWAMLHGLIVFGKNMKTSDGRLAIDVMVGDFVQRVTVEGKDTYTFPEKTLTGTPVDPHGNMIIKALLEAGVKPSRSFKMKGGGKITLQRLIDDAERTLI